MTDLYALFDLASDASASDIRKAYRKKSLKVHPDRNPDNPDADRLFHELTEAADVLLDPSKRANHDKTYAAERARKERFAALDNKRKADLADLEARETEFKRQETSRGKKADQAKEVERLKAEGERLRAEKLRGRQEEDDLRRAKEAIRVKKELKKAEKQKNKGEASQSKSEAGEPPKATPIPSENDVLRRMMERQKMEEEIRRQEAEE